MPEVSESPDNLPDVTEMLKMTARVKGRIAGFMFDILAPGVDPRDPKLEQSVKKAMDLLAAEGIKPRADLGMQITPSKSGGLRLSFYEDRGDKQGFAVSASLENPDQIQSVGWRKILVSNKLMARSPAR